MPPAVDANGLARDEIGFYVEQHRLRDLGAIGDPDQHRPFRTPFVPLVPIVGALSCLYLMASLPLVTWIRFFVWMAIGFAIYFGYGRFHSHIEAAAVANAAAD